MFESRVFHVGFDPRKGRKEPFGNGAKVEMAVRGKILAHVCIPGFGDGGGSFVNDPAPGWIIALIDHSVNQLIISKTAQLGKENGTAKKPGSKMIFMGFDILHDVFYYRFLFFFWGNSETYRQHVHCLGIARVCVSSLVKMFFLVSMRNFFCKRII